MASSRMAPGRGDRLQTAALAAVAGLAAPADHRNVADLRALGRHAVPDLPVDGERRADAVAAAQEELGALVLVPGEEHLRRQQRAHVVLHHAVKAGQLFKQLAQRIIRLGQRAEGIAHRAPVGGGDAAHRDAEPDHLLARDPVLLHQRKQALGELLRRLLRGGVCLQRDLLCEDHAAVQPGPGQDRLPQIDQNAQTAGLFGVDVDQDLPPSGVAAGEHLSLGEQPVADHLGDDFGDRRRASDSCSPPAACATWRLFRAAHGAQRSGWCA